MKKRAGFFLAMMCILVLVGCGTSNNAEKVEDNLSQPAVKDCITSGVQEPMQDTQPAVDDLSQPEEAAYQKDVEQGGIIEFAGDMTYKEFTDLNWVSDIDNSLDEDASVYIVKIYYPNGFEHHKVGKIENCEAIGIYRTDDGEYLGGSFRERTTQS